MSVHLAIDLGAESGRVIAGLVDGDNIRLDEVHRFPNGPVAWTAHPNGPSLRWPIARLWNDIQEGLSLAGRRYGAEIESIGCDTWGVDYVLLTKAGELLGQPFSYRDGRIIGGLDRAFETVSRREIFAATGLQFMEINTLYQLLASQRETPELLAHADTLLMMPDFVHWLLSGERRAEFTNATTTQFVDPTSRTWATELLDRFGLPSSMLPPIVEPGSEIGRLRPALAERLGLPEVPVIAPPTHDTGAAVVSVPTENTGRANWAYISSGTWSLIGVETIAPILTDEALEQNVTNEGGVCGTTRLLKNVMGLWLVQGVKRSIEAAGRQMDYDQLTRLAREAEPFRSLVAPNQSRFLAPDDMAEEIRQTCQETGQPIPETDGQLARCGLDSLALKYREVLRGLERLTGEKVEVLHVVGGGSQNDLLNQLTADACGVPVVAGPVEATALGNLLFQARPATDLDGLRELRRLVRKTHPLRQFAPSGRDLGDQIARFESLSQGVAGV